MRSPDYQQAQYMPLNPNTDTSYYEELSEKPSPTTKTWRFSASAALLSIVCLVAGFLVDELVRDRELPSTSKLRCDNLTIRREWRSLSIKEKHEYIGAVRCLVATPSKQLPQDSLYDDFAYVHIDTGEDAYNSTAFLPYHRYLLHVYESELKLSCGYKGSLPYWDWTLDWENLSASPVFSNTTGFGSITNTEPSDSHCVHDGPLSDLVLPFYGNVERPNCIWRALSGPPGEQGNLLSKDRLRPSTVEALLAQQSYQGFLAELENGPRVHIPNGIAGDFIEFTAANDPLFFLHHCQLDRLWWMWQQSKPEVKLQEYVGKKQHGDVDVDAVSLSDIISLGALAPDIKVEDVIDSEAQLFCYKY